MLVNKDTTLPPKITAAVFAFVPRQVTLAKQQSIMKSKTLKTVESSIETHIINNKEEKKKSRSNPSSASPLVISIAAYLQHHGFTKTLAAFQSETSIGDGELDGTQLHALDLEMYYKYLETSKCNAKSNNKGFKELDLLNDGVTNEDQEESKCAALEEPRTKKKKNKRSNGGDTVKVDEQPGDSNKVTECVNDSDDKSIKSQVKKKKSKLGSDSFDGNACDIDSETILGITDKVVSELQLDESDRKFKGKKKKKSKLILVENGGSETCSLEAKSAPENFSGEILLNEKKLKSKDKKKKNISSEDLRDQDTKEFDQVDVGVDKKSSKKRKKMASEGNESQPEGDGRQTVEVSEKKKGNPIELLESDGRAGKKRKTENGQVDSQRSQEMSLDKTPKGTDDQTVAVLHANGDLERNGREGSAPPKSTKKQQNGSAEPKTINAFQRVKIDEVEFADDRLQDNSYWAKGGAEIGYGAKAQEVLGQVRGRDFRHEKTKKKRGSYRGGQIDLQTHSIKFNYSDEE